MKCQAINYNYLSKNFKGRNDIDPSKSKSHRIFQGHMYLDSGYITISEYNSYGQVLIEQAYTYNSGHGEPYYREYSYYENGNLKSKKSKFYKDDINYSYEEYNENGSLHKELNKNGKFIKEFIYNDGGIEKKIVLKPSEIEGNVYNTVELLYKNKEGKVPYRVLAKDFWGSLLKDITDIKKLAKLTILNNKVLFKK